MKVLIVEDDDTKLRDLEKLLEENYANIKFDVAKSFQGGLRYLVNNFYNIVIFDMSMPNFDISIDEDGGRQFHFGGRELMRQMKRKGIVAATIIFTQFDAFGEGEERMTLDELRDELSDRFSFYGGTVSYSQISNRWTREMSILLNRLMSNGENP